MASFQRRIYPGIRPIWRDFLNTFRQRDRLRGLKQETWLTPAFRERLMLAVTAVNDCRYCSFYHAQRALAAGISESEIRRLQSGGFSGAPAGELPAMLYAQHWAEADDAPDPEARAAFVEHYGADRAETIELVLRLIRAGNLLGNTWDYLLYRLSFGRWGLTARERSRDGA